MVTTIVASLSFICIGLMVVRRILRRNKDPMQRFEPISNDELLLLSSFDDDLIEDVLTYIRTMSMSVRLQDHLSDKKELLETLSYFMLLQAAKQECEKKEQWEKERQDRPRARPSHVEKMILQGIKRI